MTDDALKGLTAAGPKEINELIENQVKFFVQQEKREPNCIMLGIEIITMLSNANMLERDEKSGESRWRRLKLFIDGDNSVMIACGFSPFVDLQRRIIV